MTPDRLSGQAAARSEHGGSTDAIELTIGATALRNIKLASVRPSSFAIQSSILL
jgi:hypothetical protein